MKKVYIVHPNPQYVSMFKELGYSIAAVKEQADLACFTGGADVSPSLYGDSQHPATGNDPYRDEIEMGFFEFFKQKGVPMVGICRGGQFLNVMSGGRMYQHVSKHTNDHEITDARTGEKLIVSSTHHQMFMPSEKALLVAFSTLGGYREWYDGEISRRDVSDMDFEVVFYEHTKSLCFQPHPEFTGAEYVGMRTYFSGLLKEFFN
jgi:anthranilate/para-aminobenzoate synthase component II